MPLPSSISFETDRLNNFGTSYDFFHVFFRQKTNKTLPKDTPLDPGFRRLCFTRYAISAVFMAANILPFWMTTGPMQLNECDKLDQEALAEVLLNGV